MNYDRYYDRELLVLARRAYDGPQHGESYINDRRTDTQALITVIGGVVQVAFPGTASLRDVLTDLRVPLDCGDTPLDGCRVHRGVIRAWRAVREQVYDGVWNAVWRLGGGRPPIDFAGHSLGGALAIVAGIDMARTNSWPVTVVTFGAPRVGDAALREAARATLMRCTCYVHGADPIPWVPPWHWGYRTAGKVVRIGRHPGMAMLRHALTPGRTCLADHRIDAYVDAMGAAP